jgi:hypothetical protein
MFDQEKSGNPGKNVAADAAAIFQNLTLNCSRLSYLEKHS